MPVELGTGAPPVVPGGTQDAIDHEAPDADEEGAHQDGEHQRLRRRTTARDGSSTSVLMISSTHVAVAAAQTCGARETILDVGNNRVAKRMQV